jgi:hypothetical protein
MKVKVIATAGYVVAGSSLSFDMYTDLQMGRFIVVSLREGGVELYV